MRSSCSEVLLLLNLASLVSLLKAASPFSKVPFLTVWNAPTERCFSQFGVDLDLGMFSITQNRNQTFMGGNITIFYADKLGLYPRYSDLNVSINGGVPQNSSLEEHLRVARKNISTLIPDGDFQGLAVVDWESWRPDWERNWGSKQVYWQGSRALVKALHPDWSPAQVDAAARKEFEESGRKYMTETLNLGQEMRPDGLWGFYGFPNCYNYYNASIRNYTGECPALELKRNDRLLWLWNVSSALYPDIYLSLDFRGLDREVLLYSQNRILEAMRAADQVNSKQSVFTYARIVYTYSLDFLPLTHLINTIGESVALGSGGVVLWGDQTYAKSKATCNAVKFYIDEILGFYLVNVTAAANLCSWTVCSSHGRCQRKNPKSSSYLHLDPAEWRIVPEEQPGGGRDYRVEGQMGDAQRIKSEFRCRCFSGWWGDDCSLPDKRR